MPKPMAICVENLAPRAGATRYLRCTAVPGRQPGLRVDARGEVLWRSDDSVACELWVSADDKLILFRPAGAPPVTLHRAGRSLEVPFAKPVVTIDQDEFVTGGRRLRLHVHGEAPAVSAPTPVVPEQSTLRRVARAAAAAVAIGSVVAAGGCKNSQTPPPEKPPIDVREKPPDVAMPEPPKPKIEVRERPPDMVLRPERPEPVSAAPKDAQNAPTPQNPKVNEIEVREQPPIPPIE